jgi:hypothetical protein
MLDDLRLYNRILSPTEVKRLYELGATTRVSETITANPTLETGLVGHWTFDGPDMDWSSTTAEVRDRSPYGNHGNASSSITRASVRSGVLGQALEFGYANRTKSIRVTAYPEIDNLETLSSCMWIYPYSYGPSALDSSMMYKGTWGFQLADDAGNALYFSHDRTNPAHWRSPIDAIALNTWQHVCVTYDGSLVANVPALYINGAPVTVTETATPLGPLASDTGYPLYLSEWGYSESGTNSSFDGMMDDVRLYNRILSAEEVKRLYELGS